MTASIAPDDDSNAGAIGGAVSLGFAEAVLASFVGGSGGLLDDAVAVRDGGLDAADSDDEDGSFEADAAPCWSFFGLSWLNAKISCFWCRFYKITTNMLCFCCCYSSSKQRLTHLLRLV